MTTVKLGSNDFIDCQALIGFKGLTLLGVHDEPLRVTLCTPEDAPPFAPHIEVSDNKVVKEDPKLSVTAGQDAVTIVYGSQPICVATKVGPAVIVLRIDLRPIGVVVYDDALGLHVGGSTFSKNTIQRFHTAINLG